MHILFNALSIHNLSGRYVLRGHLANLAKWTSGRHSYTVLYHKANKEGGFESEMSFENMPYVQMHFSEYTRSHMFGKEIPERLRSRTIMYSLIDKCGFMDNVYEIADDNKLVMPYIRRIIEMFSEEEVKKAYEQWNNVKLSEREEEFLKLLKSKILYNSVKILSLEIFLIPFKFCLTASLVVGSHPHIVQEVEQYKGVSIYYSLGNFIFDQYFSEEVTNGLLLSVTFTDDGVSSIQEVPIKLHPDGRTCVADPVVR